MKKLFTSNWFAALAGTIIYLATTALCFSTAKLGTPDALRNDETPLAQVSESWAFHNPELDQIIQEFKAEKDAVLAREQQLKELENRLASERQEINLVMEAVNRAQKEFDQTVLRIKQDEVPNLKKLAKVHAAMSAEGSANLFKEQTDEEVLKILFYLKPAESGPILEAIGKLGKTEAQRAALLTERMRRSLEVPAEKAKP